ncbi:Uncharacterised protein [Mycobacteroides abscessus subsp. abscessus]|nr:Uncharacterised protein [Mycobacteroides abscessus subsp. abscessus]
MRSSGLSSSASPYSPEAISSSGLRLTGYSVLSAVQSASKSQSSW